VTAATASTDDLPPPASGATAWVAAGALTGGLAAYLFQILGTRTLGAEDYAPLGVLWTLQYLLVSIGLTAVEAYVTRTVALDGPDAPRTREVQVVLVRWLVVVAVVAGVLGLVARDRLFGGYGDLALVLALLVLAYGTFTIVRGRAAGSDRFRTYAVASAAESLLRLGAGAVAVALAATTRSLAWVFPLGPAAVTAWALVGQRRRRDDRAVRRPIGDHVGRTAALPDAPTMSPTRFLASTVTANAAVQVLLAAGPLALVVLGAGPVEISVFFTTVTITRAPMTLVLNGGLSRVLPPLLRRARAEPVGGLRRVLHLTVGAGLGIAAAAGALAWVLGPPVVALLFGEAFRPSSLLAALAAAVAVLAVGGLGVNQILIALGREAELPLPWLGGVLAAAVLVVLLPLPASDAVIVACTAGMALALLLLSWRALQTGPSGATGPVR
jgi:O-antigen/teichoic acid export membrane protein